MLSRWRISWKMTVPPHGEEKHAFRQYTSKFRCSNTTTDGVAAKEEILCVEQGIQPFAVRLWARQREQTLSCGDTMMFYWLWRCTTNFISWESGFAVDVLVSKCVCSPPLFSLLWCLSWQQQVSLRALFYLLHWKVGISFSDAELSTLIIGKGLKNWDSSIIDNEKLSEPLWIFAWYWLFCQKQQFF